MNKWMNELLKKAYILTATLSIVNYIILNKLTSEYWFLICKMSIFLPDC